MMQKTDDIIIRKAVPDDAPQIAQIEKECFSSPWSEKSVRDEINNELCVFIAAEINGKICGYISGLDVSGEFYISNIAVKKEYRRNHTGTKILNELIRILRSRNCVFATLEVRESNAAAIRLYEKSGFSLKGIRKNFYTAPSENGLIYTLDF